MRHARTLGTSRDPAPRQVPPHPVAELRILSLGTLRGVNFWSRRPMTRLDLSPGRYDEISSAMVPGFVDTLVDAVPGLAAHGCSIGHAGGFLTRLREGTYAPHIIEHVAIALQNAIGHDVAHGKTRDGNARGEYTIVFEHCHALVGLRAAALAVDIVARALAAETVPVGPAIAELRSLATVRNDPPLDRAVRIGVTGGDLRHATCEALIRRHVAPEDVADLSPAYLLHAGLPYARSDVAIILDATARDAPTRYQEPERARTLVSIIADAVPEGRPIICPADDDALRHHLAENGHRSALFVPQGRPSVHHRKAAAALAWTDGSSLVLELSDDPVTVPLVTTVPIRAQLAAALAVAIMSSTARIA